MANAMGLFRYSQAPSWLFGPRTDALAEPPPPLSHRPCGPLCRLKPENCQQYMDIVNGILFLSDLLNLVNFNKYR